MTEADHAGDLAPDDLEVLAQAAWWVGQPDTASDAWERAYTLHARSGDKVAAANAAAQLAFNLLGAGLPSVLNGWVQRAERLLQGASEQPVHGFIAVVRGMTAFTGGDLDTAAAAGRRALDIGTSFGIPDLQAMGLHLEGRALVAKGRVEEGMALLDEATAAAVSGELSPQVTGRVYCSTVSACWGLGDYRRAGEWADAAERWCRRRSINGFPGVCRLHRAQIQKLRGMWREAEAEALLACKELPSWFPLDVGRAMSEIGEIRLRMGELEAAEEIFTRARDLGRDPEPGLSLLRLGQGKVDTAARSIKRALEDESLARLDRARLLPAQVEIALAAGDVRTARVAAEEIETITGDYTISEVRTPALEASAQMTWGAVRLAEQDPDEAVTCLRRAIKLWQEVDHPYEAARTRVLLAAAYRAKGDEDGAIAELVTAQSAFERLGARLDAERAKELLGRLETRRTFVFTDIVDSTKFAELLKDRWEKVVLKVHDETIKRIASDYGGEVVKSTGDGFFLAFPEPTAGVEAAVAIQKQLDEQAFPAELRIGLHMTEAQDTGGDYQGEGINVAARIGELAEGGQILASCDSVIGIPLVCSAPNDAQLKGFSDPVKVTSIDWR